MLTYNFAVSKPAKHRLLSKEFLAAEKSGKHDSDYSG
jgi:hypothetical protein